MQELPEEIEAVHTILWFLRDIDGLSDDPAYVEITREGYPSVFPCRKPKENGKLDLEQIDWAKENGKWWFIGPIESCARAPQRTQTYKEFKVEESGLVENIPEYPVTSPLVDIFRVLMTNNSRMLEKRG